MTLLLNPYFWIAAVLSLALSMFGGCQWQAHNDEAKIQSANLQVELYKADVSTLSESLNQINAIADQAKREAAAKAAIAADAVEQAGKDRETYEKQIDAAGAALERAKRQPVCRAQLEAISCADFQ